MSQFSKFGHEWSKKIFSKLGHERSKIWRELGARQIFDIFLVTFDRVSKWTCKIFQKVYLLKG